MTLTDIINFLEESRKLRMYHLKNENSNSSKVEKRKCKNGIKVEIYALIKKYPNLESPEKEYLDSLVKFYDVNNGYKLGELSKQDLDVLDTKINELDLSIRTYKFIESLFKEKPVYLGEIVQLKERDLLNVKPFNKRFLREIKEEVATYGFVLGDKLNYFRPEQRNNDH